MSENWHNGTVQGQRNTAVAKFMKKRAQMELRKWVDERRKKELKEPGKGRRLRSRRRRLIAHKGAF